MYKTLNFSLSNVNLQEAFKQKFLFLDFNLSLSKNKS